MLTDLGATMSCDTTFIQHILSICSNVRKQAGWALRTYDKVQAIGYIWKPKAGKIILERWCRVYPLSKNYL